MAHVPAAERRPQLIQAAIDLMTREGVGAGSTRAVAAELGVAQATVHYTLGSKEELYRAVLEKLSEEVIAQVRAAAPPEGSFEETLDAMARELWGTVRDDPGNSLLLIELTSLALRSPVLLKAVSAHLLGIVDATAALIEEAAERTGFRLAQPPEGIARFFLAGFDGLTLQRLTLDDIEVHEATMTRLVATTVALATGKV